jgi:hypothetical protein
VCLFIRKHCQCEGCVGVDDDDDDDDDDDEKLVMASHG